MTMTDQAALFAPAMQDDLERIEAIGKAGVSACEESDRAWLEAVATAEAAKLTTNNRVVRVSAALLLESWRNPPAEIAVGESRSASKASEAPPRPAHTGTLEAVVAKALAAHNPGSEAQVLAALIGHPTTRNDLFGLLEPGDFHVLANRLIFERLRALDIGGPFDLDLALATWGRDGALPPEDARPLLEALARRVVEPGTATRHAELVRRLGDRRRTTGALLEALRGVASGATDPAHALDAIARLPVAADEAPSSGWPAAPSDAVYHGPLGELVKAVEPHTEADPIAVLASLLVIFGNLLGRTAHWSVNGRRHYCNLFLAIVGPSSSARKGTAFDVAESLLRGIDDGWDATFPLRGMCSGEGFIEAVKDPDVMQKNVVWFEAEFGATAGVIARDGNNLSAKVRDAFDHGNLASLSRVNPVRTTDAHISIIAHATFRELRENLQPREFSNGFVNRFAWLCSRRTRLLPNGGDLGLLDVDPYRRQFARAYDFARTPSVRRQAFPLDTECQTLWAAVYQRLNRARPGRLGDILARSYVITRRLAVLYAVLDRSRQVRRPHLDAALELWGYCERSARFIFGEGEDDAILQRVFDAIAGSGDKGVNRTELARTLFGKRDAKKLDACLGALSGQGLVEPRAPVPPARGETWHALV